MTPSSHRGAYLAKGEVEALLARAAETGPGTQAAFKALIAEGLRTGEIAGQPLRVDGQALAALSAFSEVAPEVYLQVTAARDRPLSPHFMNQAFRPRRAVSGAADPAPAGAVGSPLAVRLGQVQPSSSNPSSQQVNLQRALSEVLGVDIPALDELSVADIDKGKVEVRIELQSPSRVKLPVGDGEPLELQIPKVPAGIALVASLEIGEPEADSGVDGPVIKKVAIDFDTTLRDPRTGRAPIPYTGELAADNHPRILNPGAVATRGRGVLGSMLGGALDRVADVRFRGATINGEGELDLQADVLVGGFDVLDLGGLARRAPRLNVELDKLARGEVFAGRAPSTSSPSTSAPDDADRGESFALNDIIASFSEVASRASWSAEIESERFPLSRLASEGDLHINRDLDVRGRASLEARLDDNTLRVELEGENQTDGRVGGASVRSVFRGEQGERVVSSGVSWSEEGMEVEGLPLNDILPVELTPWTGSSHSAPRVGEAAFTERVESILDGDAPLHPVRKAELLHDGAEVLKRRLELIDGAGEGDTVLLQTFIFKDDVTGQKTIDALIGAHRRGADVRVVMDAVGTARTPKEVLRGPEALHKLREAGVPVALADVPDRAPLAAIAEHLAELPGVRGDTAELAASGLKNTERMLELLEELGDVSQLLERPELAVRVVALAKQVLQEIFVDTSLPPEARDKLKTLTTELLEGLPKSLSCDHRKQLVVYGGEGDEAKAELVVGGNNIGDDYLIEPHSPDFSEELHADVPLWNDLDMHVSSDGLVAQSARDFARTWARATGDDVTFAAVPALAADAGDSQRMRLVDHVPIAAAEADEGDNHFSNLLLAALEGARAGDRLVIQNPYFLPVPELRDAMIDAGRRGAEIEILTNGSGDNNDAKIVSDLSRRFVLNKLLLEQGITVYETYGDVQAVHKKALSMITREGKDLFMVGSQNLDSLSARVNREVFVVGGSAIDDGADGVSDISRELFESMTIDKEASYSEELNLFHVPSRDRVQDLAGDYVRSLLMPVV